MRGTVCKILQLFMGTTGSHTKPGKLRPSHDVGFCGCGLKFSLAGESWTHYSLIDL